MDYKKLIADKLSKSIELETSQIEDMLEIPAKAEMGDLVAAELTPHQRPWTKQVRCSDGIGGLGVVCDVGGGHW